MLCQYTWRGESFKICTSSSYHFSNVWGMWFSYIHMHVYIFLLINTYTHTLCMCMSVCEPCHSHQKNKNCKKWFCSLGSVTILFPSVVSLFARGPVSVLVLPPDIRILRGTHLMLTQQIPSFFLWETARRYSITLTFFSQDNDGANKHSSWLRRKV